MPVSSIKGKIADQIGVPVGQQRLIFQGKVLKDEHLLSKYRILQGHWFLVLCASVVDYIVFCHLFCQ